MRWPYNPLQKRMCSGSPLTFLQLTEQALQKEADHSTGPPCCLEKGRGPAQASLKKGRLPLSSSTKLLEEAAALAKAAREEKKELSHLEARALSVASSKKSRK